MDSCAQIAGRWITHKHFPQRTPVGVLGSAEWKLVRIIMAKNSVKCALATIHKDLQTQAKPFENAHKFSDKHVDSYAQIAGRWITHKHFPQRTPVGVLGSAEWKLVRIIMAKNSVKCALATIHKDLQTQAKPFENAHKFSNKHVDSCAQIAGRWITHKHFPQRTPVGVLGSAEWKLVRIIMAKNSVK